MNVPLPNLKICLPIVSILILVLMVGCTTTTVRKHRPTDTPTLEDRTNGIFRPTSVTNVYIEDDWEGESPVAPITAHFEVNRTDKDFAGIGEISVGPNSKRKARFPLRVPMLVMREFLYALSGAFGNAGEYVPDTPYTDSFPRRRIELTLSGGETVILQSESQGTDNVPWGMKVGKSVYVVEGETASHALLMLFPYLRPDLVRRLEDQVYADLEREGAMPQ